LRNPEPVSRPAKASRFGDREKIAEVANVQRLRHGKEYCPAQIANAIMSLIGNGLSASIIKTYRPIFKTFNKNAF
jgi:hypothetical protein